MGKYNSVNDVLAGHINALIEKKGLKKSDYPFQNDMYSAMSQLTNVYAKISGKSSSKSDDSFSIVGALDSLLDVVDSIISPGSDPEPQPGPGPEPEPEPTYLTVTNGKWNIRSEPSATAEIIGSCKAGDKLISRDTKSGGWIGIKFEDNPAWISQKAFV